MRLIVTGATGFVGGAAVRTALARGHEVTAVVRPASKKLDVILKGNERAIKEGRLILAENDLGEPEKLPEILKAGPYGVFCHFGWGGAGSGSRTAKELQEQNRLASLRTVRAARELGCGRFLFSGSQAEYGMHGERMTEESECRPCSVYGEEKLRMRTEGEALCRELGMEYVHARIFSAYGPGDHPWTLVESCLDAFLSGKEILLGSCAQQWNFLHIDDLAAAVCALAELPAGRLSGLKNPVFNLAGSRTRPLKEFVEEIYELCGRRGGRVYGARPENAEGPVNLIPDIAKLEALTGWSPQVDFAAGIQRMIAARETGRADKC